MKPVVRWLVLVAFVVAILSLSVVTAFAASVDPVTVPGNPKLCEGGLKIDPVAYGETTVPWTFKDAEGNDVEVSVTINVYDTAMGPMMDFSVTGGVAYKVVAKGGREGANVYDYSPDGVSSDTGLHCPVNPSGKYAAFSHIDFCFGGGGTTELKGALSGSKWYDLNMDGYWDIDEDAIEGWKIILYKWDVATEMWVYADHKFTNPAGAYTFADLPPGTYKVEEGPVSGKWMQTWPKDPNYYAGLVITQNEIYEELDFGNVCVRGDVKGYTMGFWSNKNGLAAMNAFVAGGGMLPGNMTPSQVQGYFRKAANAVDMCVMLKAQYLAHQLNVLVPVGGKTANYAGGGVIINGVVYSYDDVMADFAAFDCSSDRKMAEWYKDFFDGLNNNCFKVVEYTPCPVPTW